jgi:hypothetical protein
MGANYDPFTAPDLNPMPFVPNNNGTGVLSTNPNSAANGHLVIVSIAVLLGMAVLFTEVGGTSKQAATVIILLLVGLVLIQGMTHQLNFSNFASKYPTGL